MEKTTLYLPDDLKSAVKRAAARQGVSEADVIRRSIRQAVGDARPRPRGGLFRSGRPVARQADQALAGFGERSPVAGLIVDTSALLAYFDASEPDHAEVTETIDASSDLLIVSPYVVAELDYLVATRHGVQAELAVLEELAGGAWHLAVFDDDDLKRARTIIAAYVDQGIGVAEASNVVLADRYRTTTIMTLDRRHFEILRPITGGRFTALPHAH